MTYSILNEIGNTPLIEIKKLNPNPNVKILAKLEYLNPGGSVKDRAALFMIENGEKTGELTPEKIDIEATSGNTGIGLALICSVKGYKLVLAMSESVSQERQKILKARGAEIILTPAHLSTDGAIEEVYRLAREYPYKYFATDQFNNEANWKAHYYTTAPEIWKQTNGEVSAIIATMGTSGTLMGLSRRLKEYNKNIQIIGVEPYLGHKIQGLKNMKGSYCPYIFDKSLLDEKINIEDELAFHTARELATKEGLLVGMSSGAAMAIAQEYAKKMEKGTLVVILPDGGERYLSTSLYTIKNDLKLNLYDATQRSKRFFEPAEKGSVKIYSCGPCVGEQISFTQVRKFVIADILIRYLEYRGFSVSHVMNLNDLDDKTVKSLQKSGKKLEVLTDEYLKELKQVFKFLKLNCPSLLPKVSDHLDDMVDFAIKLQEKGHAYEKLRSLYFDISSLKSYGSFSGINIEKMKTGLTVDLDAYEKDNPRDFTLFKRAGLLELKKGLYVKTKWGSVKPSLHLQCAAIAMKYFGENFDIHMGRKDSIFPHHENEMAIARAISCKKLANHWIHLDRVTNTEKTYSAKEFLNLEYSGRVLRFWLFSGHYKKIMPFSQKAIQDTQKSLQKIDRCITRLQNIKQGKPYPEIEQLLYDIKHNFMNAMDDDLKTPKILADIFTTITLLNKLLQQNNIDQQGANKVIKRFKDIDSVLQIFNFDKNEQDERAKNILHQRQEARQKGNFDLADELRKQLVGMGVEVSDEVLERLV